MPSAVVKSFAKKSGKSVKEIEKMWNKVLAKVKETYEDKDDDEIYAIVTGILKKNLKIQEEDSAAAITTSTAGDVSSYGGAGNFAPKLSTVLSRIGDFKPKKKKKVNEVNEYIDTFVF